MMSRGKSATTIIAAGLAAAASTLWRPATASAQDKPKTYSLEEAFTYDFQGVGKDAKFLGLDGCGSNACHGGGASTIDPAKVMAQRTTYEKDPHHEAHLKSKRMREKAKEIKDKLGLEERPEKSQRCLACHAMGGRNFVGEDLPDARKGGKYDKRDGVSCESCHGAGEKFVEEHNKKDGYAKGVALGMTPTLDPLIRANLCLSCHGKIDAELVNKGGHPKAQAIVLNVYRKEHQHWPDKSAGDQARVWIIGQVAGLYGNLAAVEKPNGADSARASELVKAHRQALAVFAKAMPALAASDFSAATQAGAQAQYDKIKDAKISDAEAKSLAKALADGAAGAGDVETCRQLLGGFYCIGVLLKDAGIDTQVTAIAGPVMSDEFTLDAGKKLASDAAGALK